MVNLPAVDDSSLIGCFAPVDLFSSCDDLLKDGALRAFIWILGLSALVGNVLVIALRVFRKEAVKANPIQSRMIFNLAFSDLMMGLYMLIIASADQHYRGDYAIHADDWRNSGTCQFAGFLSALSSEVSVFLITLLSFDRLVCVVLSHKPALKMSDMSSKVTLGIIWAVGLVISLIPLAFDQFYGRSSVCLGLPLTTDRREGYGYSVAIFLVLNFLCFLVTAGCYIAIYMKFYKSNSKFSTNKTRVGRE